MTAPYSPDNPFAQPKRPTYSPDNPFAASPETPPLEAPLSVVTKRAHQGDAGLMAEAFVLSKRTGLPVQTVARRMNAVRDLAGDKDFAPGEFVKAYPATARWLTDEANATVSKDDWSNLGMIERLVGADWRVVGTGQQDMAQRAASFGATGGLGIGLPTATAQAAPRQRGLLRAEYDKEATVVELGRIGAIPPGQRDAALRARQAELEALRAVELPVPENFAERMLRGSAKFAPSIVESAKEGGIGAGVGAVVGGAVGALAGGAGALPGAAFGAKVGGALNAFRAAAEMEGGNAVLAFEKLTDANGNAVDPDLAYTEGMMYGVASGAVELVGLSFLAKPFAKVASPILRGGVSKAMQQATTRGALAAGAKAWGAAVAGETATEVIQQGLQLAGEAELRLASNVLDDTDFDGIPLNRVARELFETGVETAIGMALIGIPGGTVVTVDGLARAAEANATRDRLTMLTESAAGSKLRERAPDQFKALLDQQIAEHGGARDVFIAADRLQLLLQEQGVSPDEFVAAAGIAPEVYQQAVAMTGADVVIPLADFAARVVGTPLGDAMLEDVRVRQGAMSAREARQVEKDADAFYAPIREEMEALTVPDVTEDEERFVVEDLTAKLEATGTYTPDQVRTMVEAAAKPYIVLGRRYAEVNPERGVRWLYETRNLKIVAGQRADLLYSTARAIQRAVAEGKSPDAVSALRVRYNKLADERVQIRAAAESIEQTQGVRDEAGRLRKSLRFVSDESLVLEYISLRDQVSQAAGELAALESTPEVSAALQMNPEMTEDRTGAVEGLAFTANVEGGFAGVEALMREARTLVRKYERTVPRLAAELAARGITDPDAYAAERDLLGDASFDPEGMAFQRAMPDTVLVDGVARPTRNSNGQPIHPTEEGVINFWRWFGDSKVVDAEGRPLVVYHGTQNAVFDEFETPSYFSESAGESAMYAVSEESYQRSWRGARTTDAPNSLADVDDGTSMADASWWDTGKWYVVGDAIFRKTGERNGEPVLEMSVRDTSVRFDWASAGFVDVPIAPMQQPAIYAAYLRLSNPVTLSALDGNDFAGVDNERGSANRTKVQRLEREGYDGAIAESDQGLSRNFIPFAPAQVKSAIGNAGTFDASASILTQRDLSPIERDVTDMVARQAALLRRTATALRARGKLSDAELARLADVLGTVPDLLEQAAFHGTPYVFDKFSLEKIGTGEGAQAYGFGLYFAESQAVAEGYRKTLTNARQANDLNGRFAAIRIGNRPIGDIANTELDAEFASLAESSSLQGARGYAEQRIGRWAELAADGSYPFQKYAQEKSAEWQKVSVALASARDISSSLRGALYRVDIADDVVATFLDWDKSLSEQAPKVRKIVEAMQEAEQVFRTRPAPDGKRTEIVSPTGDSMGFYAASEVDEAIENFKAGYFGRGIGNRPLTGEDIYNRLTRAMAKPERAASWTHASNDTEDRAWSAQEAASKALLAAGIRGIKYLDAGSRSKGWILEELSSSGSVRFMQRFDSEESARSSISKYVDPALVRIREDVTRNLVVFDENDVTITHRNGEPVTTQERADFLEQNESRSRRQTNAFILPGRVEQIIGLMETANLSSFLHEMGHEYLNLLAFVAEQPDAPQGVQDDLAVALKSLGADSAASLTVAQQELWARSFEAYLKDGTAPSRPLLRAFTRFRIWLTDVYRAVVNALPTVSPELRGVFDRLLATEDELAEMRRQPEAAPLFTEAVEGVLTDAEYAAYQSAVAFRDATAGAQLARDLLAETNKARTAAWAEREADVREAVTALVDAAPVEKAVVYLRTGTLPDGTVQDAPVRLSKVALVERYGPGVTKTLPTKTFSVEGGMDADSAALLLGFDTGDALIDALQRYEPRAAKIERLVGSEMRRLFPDLLYDSPALADAAADAMHRTETDELLVLELKKLGKAVGTVAPNLVTVKQVARDIIGETAARDLSPYKFQQAERKAARLAEQAVRAQDWGRAEFHKRQQLLNHILYREARAAEERVGQVQRFFTRMAKGSSQERMGKAGQHHREAMNEILDRYEFRDVSLRRMDRRASILDYVAQVAGEELIALTMPEHVLRDAAVTNYRTLTMDQLEGVYQSGKMIWHVVTKKDKLLAKMAKQTLTEQAEAVAAAIAEHRPLKPRQLDTRESPFQLAEEWRAKVDAWHLPPEFLFRWLDGDQPLGVVWEAFFRPMADAESAENVMLKDADAQMKALEAMVPESRKREFWDKEVTVPGLNARVKGRTIIAVALNWGSESNREAILASTVDGNAVWQSAGAVERALSLLTRDELAYVQAKWDYLNTFWPEIKALEEAMVGVAPEKVESSPFTVRLADGTEVAMQGGYYPLKYDGGLSAKQSFLDAASLAEGVNEISPKGGARAQTRHGFTETRVGSGGKPVLLDLSVFNTHVINVIHDLTHRRAIMDVVRLYQRPEVEQAIVQSAGQPMYEAIRPWLVRIAQPDQTFDNSFAERLLSRARTGTTVVNMGFKVTTGVTQILGFTQSLDMIGPKWVSKGVAAFLSNPAKAWREVKAMSPEMENRRTNFNREVRDYAVSRKGKWARRDEFFFAFVGMMDMVVSVPTWIGAYRQSFETLAPGNHADAVAYADSVVRMSQSAGSPKDLARIQGGPELRRLLTMHYSFFSRLYGLMRRSGTNLREGRWGVPRFLASMTLLWFASSVLSELLAGRWPEDDDEDGLERMTWEVLRYPASTVVGLRDLARAVGPDRFDYKLTPAEDMFIQTGRTLNVAYRATLGDFMDDETEFELSESDIKAMTLTAGYWGRLPSRQAIITGGTLYDWMMGYDAPESVVDAARDLSFTRPR